MAVHIVRVNDKIEHIANIYNLTTDELIKINHHIQDWDNLIPGTKLRLPEIPSNVELELDNTEPFIEEYYPKIDINELNIKKELNNQVNNNDESLQQSSDDAVVNNTSSAKVNHKKSYYPFNPYYNYYGYYYGYPPYNYYRKSKSKSKTK